MKIDRSSETNGFFCLGWRAVLPESTGRTAEVREMDGRTTHPNADPKPVPCDPEMRTFRCLASRFFGTLVLVSLA